MSDEANIKMSVSEELFSTFALRGKKLKKTNFTESGPRTSYEVFRNNTTAVEVIVKEVPSNKKKKEAPQYHNTALTRKLQEDVTKLRKDLNKANAFLERTRKGYSCCLREMQKQVDTANQREIDTRAKNLALQLENEKLKTFLVSKTNLVFKLKKELSSLRRIMKFIVKIIINIPSPPVELDNGTYDTDPEYDDFESNLRKDVKIKFGTLDEMSTFDSTMSKDGKNKIEKRLYEL